MTIRKETYIGYVYDLCIEDTHNFVAENILCHNTTTAIKLSTFFTDNSSIYFSFNKKIQVDTTRKLNALGSKMIASTVHSFGLMCMNAYFPKDAKCQMKNSKYDDLIESYMEKHWNSFFSSIRSDLSDKELEKSGEWVYEAKTCVICHSRCPCW